jgi:hypothetical protein
MAFQATKAKPTPELEPGEHAPRKWRDRGVQIRPPASPLREYDRDKTAHSVTGVVEFGFGVLG